METAISYRLQRPNGGFPQREFPHLLTGTGGGIERDHIGLAAKNAPGNGGDSKQYSQCNQYCHAVNIIQYQF